MARKWEQIGNGDWVYVDTSTSKVLIQQEDEPWATKYDSPPDGGSSNSSSNSSNDTAKEDKSGNILSDTMDNLNMKNTVLDFGNLENNSSIYALGLFMIVTFIFKAVGGVFE